MTTAHLEARVAIAEQRIAALEAERANLATKSDAERAITNFTWTLATSTITLAGVVLTALFTSATFIVINAMKSANG